MIKTLPLDELLKNADNIYEAIVIMAKRARQINELQKKIIDKETEALAQTNDMDDDVINTDLVEGQFLKLPKPTTTALEEMLEGKLTREYLEKSE